MISSRIVPVDASLEIRVGDLRRPLPQRFSFFFFWLVSSGSAWSRRAWSSTKLKSSRLPGRIARSPVPVCVFNNASVLVRSSVRPPPNPWVALTFCSSAISPLCATSKLVAASARNAPRFRGRLAPRAPQGPAADAREDPRFARRRFGAVTGTRRCCSGCLARVRRRGVERCPTRPSGIRRVPARDPRWSMRDNARFLENRDVSRRLVLLDRLPSIAATLVLELGQGSRTRVADFDRDRVRAADWKKRPQRCRDRGDLAVPERRPPPVPSWRESSPEKAVVGPARRPARRPRGSRTRMIRDARILTQLYRGPAHFGVSFSFRRRRPTLIIRVLA